jgi:hypothetical protein
MIGGFRPQANFLHFNVLLCLAGLLPLLFLFVEELSQVHHLADRRIGVRGYLYQVKFSFPGDFLGFFNRYYSNVFPIGVN